MHFKILISGSKSVKFAQNFGIFLKFLTLEGTLPLTSLEPFFILNVLQNNSAGKNTLGNMVILGAPSLKKFLEYVADVKTFSKRCLHLFGV